jgi:3-deoxy-manno-octulosonate cytidylyltransferase (CMP-KDO synthetase)
MKIIGIIPSRYASTRFPAKPLALIAGKSLVERVWRQAKKSRLLSEVFIATDDNRIRTAAEAFGAKVIMTSRNCKSGTDRLAEAARKAAKDARVLINIQGDEPVISPDLIDSIARCFVNDDKLASATAAYPLKDKRELNSPNVVKVVFDSSKNAMYFSRRPIPYARRPKQPAAYYKHIGIYGYRRDFLLKFSGWRQSPLEKTEQLEQLRILENGERMKVVISKVDSFGVDVPADIQKIERILK